MSDHMCFKCARFNERANLFMSVYKLFIDKIRSESAPPFLEHKSAGRQ